MLLYSSFVGRFLKFLTNKYHFEREWSFLCASNLIASNFYFREIDATILTYNLESLNNEADDVVLFIFCSAVLEKFIKELPWWMRVDDSCRK